MLKNEHRAETEAHSCVAEQKRIKFRTVHRVTRVYEQGEKDPFYVSPPFFVFEFDEPVTELIFNEDEARKMRDRLDNYISEVSHA